MHIFAGLFRLKENNKMGHSKIWFHKKLQTFLKEANHKMNDKKHLSSEKQRVQCIFTIQSLLKQRRSENLVLQKKGSTYLYIVKVRCGKLQITFCIKQCILLLGGNSISYVVSDTICDQRNLLKMKKRLLYKIIKDNALPTFNSQIEIKWCKLHQ